jgi:hypothetical protein
MLRGDLATPRVSRPDHVIKKTGIASLDKVSFIVDSILWHFFPFERRLGINRRAWLAAPASLDFAVTNERGQIVPSSEWRQFTLPIDTTGWKRFATSSRQ